MRNQHGPPCSSDADCKGVPDCVRCAHSGYCTDQPLLAAAYRGIAAFASPGVVEAD